MSISQFLLVFSWAGVPVFRGCIVIQNKYQLNLKPDVLVLLGMLFVRLFSYIKKM